MKVLGGVVTHPPSFTLTGVIQVDNPILSAWNKAGGTLGYYEVSATWSHADGDYELVWLKWNVYKTQEMYNLTVDTAHTFFVGEGQWLVHNSCNWLGEGKAPKWGEKLAEYTDNVYKNMPFYPRSHSTVAIAENNGMLYATSFGDSRAGDYLKQNEKVFNYKYIPNNSEDHAERFIYNYFNGNVGGIGVSHSKGPCTTSGYNCLGFFTRIQYSNVFWTGKWK
jgi:hypothetical protein